MRLMLKSAREAAKLTQKEVATKLNVCERYYRSLENGEKEGRCALWDSLESIFKIPQRQLRENR